MTEEIKKNFFRKSVDGFSGTLSLCIWLLLFYPGYSFAQPDRPVMKFGADISPETFAPALYSIDSAADAVILFDKGLVHFDRAAIGSYGFSIVYERHTRIRLLHKNAFHLATVIIAKQIKGNRDVQINDLKGATYNLEDGRLMVTKLDQGHIYKENDGPLQLEKVVFPNIKEGSVIEYSYRVIYPGFSYMPSWDFQGEYPVLWSEYDITVPSLVEYIVEKKGYLKFTVDTSVLSTQVLPISLPGERNGFSYNGDWRGETLERIWAIRNVPALAKKEPYITTLKNYVSSITFQLSALNMQGVERNFRNTWDNLVDELMKSDLFGAPLNANNHWMKNELRGIAVPEGAAPENARKIYCYVRDHFDCSNTTGIYLSQPLKKTWDDKRGNTADINLLLTALLRHQGFEAAPVILSTRGHGRAFESYPLLKDYNYVITRLMIGNQTYLLDATQKEAGFGQLPEMCYNGSGRAIDAEHELIALEPDSLTERRTTVVVLANNDSLGYSGSFHHTEGRFESFEMRNRMKSLDPEVFFENVRRSMPGGKTMEEHGFDSLNNLEEPVSWHYSMSYHFSSSRVYFNPVMQERLGKNPFSSPERYYPVEMPYREDYSYIIDMEIPKGYTVDEMPRSERVLLDSGSSGMFEYIIAGDAEKIQLRYHLLIKKTFFSIEEYPALRDFFDFIIRKEREQIVFKRK